MNDLGTILAILGALVTGGMVIRLVVGGRRWRVWIMPKDKRK